MPFTQSTSPHEAALELTEADAAKPITLRAGQRLRVALKENPSTGYRWMLLDPCSSYLHPEGDSFQEPAGDGGQKPGAPGEHAWTFLAASPGSCELKFVAARPWEKTTTGQGLTFALAIAP